MDDMVDDMVTMVVNFPGDGIYTCGITMISPIDSYNESYSFTVQYPIEGMTVGLVSSDNDDPPKFVNYETLWANTDFLEEFHFQVRRLDGSPLPTNTSWIVDFGNGIVRHSSEFIVAEDEKHDYVDTEHTITFIANFTEGGDFTANITLWNLISKFTGIFEYRIYEEVYMPEINTILHIVCCGTQ